LAAGTPFGQVRSFALLAMTFFTLPTMEHLTGEDWDCAIDTRIGT